MENLLDIKGVNSFEELVKRHLNVIYLDDLVGLILFSMVGHK